MQEDNRNLMLFLTLLAFITKDPTTFDIEKGFALHL